MPTSRKTMTMPVSWQMGRLPSAHMRELTSTWRSAALAAGDSSFSYAPAMARMKSGGW